MPGALRAAPEGTPTLVVAGPWHELLESPARATVLEARLGVWLREQRWFGGKRGAVRVSIAASVALARDTRLVLLRTSQPGSAPAIHLVALRTARMAHGAPLAHLQREGSTWRRSLVEAADDPALARHWIALARAGRTTELALGTLVGSVDARLARRAWRAARRASDDQTNTCFVIDDEVVCKLKRRLDGGPSVEVEVLTQLAPRAAALGVPRLLGTLDLRGADGTVQTVASFTRFVPNQGTAWELALEELRRIFDRARATGRAPPRSDLRRGAAPAWVGASGAHRPARPRSRMRAPAAGLLGAFPAVAARLGRRIADLHRALAACAAPGFVPRRLSTREERLARRELAERVLDALERGRPHLPERAAALAREVVARRQEILARLRGGTPSLGLRVHGDLHLGQVLRAGHDLVIVDFEGEPARSLPDRRRLRPALTDVAGMLRSFDYATRHALVGATPDEATLLAAWAERWLEATSSAFLAEYRARVEPAGLVPADDEALWRELGVCLLEKALYEVKYELDHRPAWVTLPLEGLLRLLERGDRG